MTDSILIIKIFKPARTLLIIMRTAIGVDIGGTKIEACLVDEEGRILVGGMGTLITPDKSKPNNIYSCAELVAEGRGGREDGLVAQMPPDIGDEPVDGLITLRPVFLQRLHHDPVEITLELFLELFRNS